MQLAVSVNKRSFFLRILLGKSLTTQASACFTAEMHLQDSMFYGGLLANERCVLK